MEDENADATPLETPESAQPRQQWDQIEGEPTAAFTRFVVYLNLGVVRSVRQAQKGAKGRSPSGYSAKLCRQWNWVARALAWDRHNVAAHGERIALAFVAALERLAMQVLQALNDQQTEPKTSAEVLEIIKALSPFVTAELIQRVQSADPRPTRNAV